MATLEKWKKMSDDLIFQINKLFILEENLYISEKEKIKFKKNYYLVF